ncbi:MAG: hypothetical protein JXB62_05255 [Pirellulales bacterium]|nr:hypothetical protein [Pirellulales bacterium]
MHQWLPVTVSACLLVQGLPVSAAMQLQSYEPLRHDRFFDPSDPDKDFLGDPYDLSGVGRRYCWATMISPRYFLSAAHHHDSGGSLYFCSTNDPEGPVEIHAIESGTQIAGTDLWLGKLTTPVSREVATYPILSLPADSDYDHLEIYTFGRSDTLPSWSSVRLGRNTIDPNTYETVTDSFGSRGVSYHFDFDELGGVGADESYLQSGDSGGPSLAIYDGMPALVGIHWYIWEDADSPGAVGSADTFVPHYVEQIAAAMADEPLIVLPEPVLTWDGLSDGDWNAAGRWHGAPANGVPNIATGAVVPSKTVTVSGNSGAYSLEVRSGGQVVVVDAATLEVFADVEATDGTLQIGGTLIAETADLHAAVLRVAPHGRLSIDDTLRLDDAQYTCEVGGPRNGLLAAGGEIEILPGSKLRLGAIGRLPCVGDAERIVLSSGAVRGVFDQQPDLGEHLGSGVFHRGVAYTEDAVSVSLFQAADGDANGDRQVNGLDIQAILAAGKFGTGIPADWTEGDFTGDAVVNGIDIQAVLAANLFGTGSYAQVIRNEETGGTVRLVVRPGGLTIETRDVLINGYVLESRDGVFTGEAAENLGLFQEDQDDRISGNLLFTLVGNHWLGDVIGDGLVGTDLLEDLRFAYTVDNKSGVYHGCLVLPEPTTMSMLSLAFCGLLLSGLRRARRGRSSDVCIVNDPGQPTEGRTSRVPVGRPRAWSVQASIARTPGRVDSKAILSYHIR